MDIKELKEFEERLNKKLNGKPVDAALLGELLSEMNEMEADGQTITISFDKSEDGAIKASAKVRSNANIDNMSKSDLEEFLQELEEELEELEDEEPDDSEEDAYEEWEERMDELEEEIDKVKEKLEELKEVKLNIKLSGVSCLTEEYVEFTKIAKPVLIDGAADNTLVAFLQQNEKVKKSVLDICNLILVANSVSISLIQRKLKIGYNKAGIIVEMLEDVGAITPFDGKTSRKVKAEQLVKLKSYVE